WGMPTIPSTDGGDSAKVDVQALTGREAALKTRVIKANIQLAKGLAEIEYAVGNATMAAKLEAAAASLASKPTDIENCKKEQATINDAEKQLAQVDMNAKMNKEEARKRLGKSLLNLCAASLLDVQAANDAKVLVTDITNGIKAAKASPMTYGVSAVTNLTSGLNTANFVVETIPPQISTTAKLSQGLAKYAQTNKIELPSQQEIADYSKNLDKQES